jgi:hypothetical protein
MQEAKDPWIQKSRDTGMRNANPEADGVLNLEL